MFKKLIILTAVLLTNSSDQNHLLREVVIEIKGEQVKLAEIPINAIMNSRFVYNTLDTKTNISFNTNIRDYNFEEGHLENKVDDSLISIPKGETYLIQQKQMDLFVKLGFFIKDKNYIYVGKDNLKGFYKGPIKVISNNVVVEETKKIAGGQYRITKLGTEHLIKRNREILICLGYLKANILLLVKNYNQENYTASYKLSLEETPTWINEKESIELFPFLTTELNKIKESTNSYTVNLIQEDNVFKVIKGIN